METRIDADLGEARRLLDADEIVAIPTETVYGLAANALSRRAVVKIFEAKSRPFFDPLIVHLPSPEHIDDYVRSIPDPVRELMRRFSPGALTAVLPRKDIIPDLVTGGNDTVAVRIPGHPLTLELLKQLDYPLAAPSANPFGYISPTTAEHVRDQLDGKIPYILDGGECRIGLESTIITYDDSQWIKILRPGGVTAEELKSVYPYVEFDLSRSNNPQAPGQLKSHYAPSARVVRGNVEQLAEQYKGSRYAILSFKTSYDLPAIEVNVLSPEGDPATAARRLFRAMRQLDALKPDVILAEIFPDEGLGQAINDRLARAAA